MQIYERTGRAAPEILFVTSPTGLSIIHRRERIFREIHDRFEN